MLSYLVNKADGVCERVFKPHFLCGWSLEGTPSSLNSLNNEKDWADDFGMYMMGDEL
jgi:hypothetical protein